MLNCAKKYTIAVFFRIPIPALFNLNEALIMIISESIAHGFPISITHSTPSAYERKYSSLHAVSTSYLKSTFRNIT